MKGMIIKGSLPDGDHTGYAGGWILCVPDQKNPECLVRLDYGLRTPRIKAVVTVQDGKVSDIRLGRK